MMETAKTTAATGDPDSQAAGISRGLWLIVLALLGIIVVNTIFESVLSRRAEGFANRVNLAGRQRMLTLGIAYLTERMRNATNSVQAAAWRTELLAATDELERTHHGLLQGDPGLKIRPAQARALPEIYFGKDARLDERVRTYVKQARVVVDAGASDVPVVRTAAEALSRERKPLLETFDELVQAIEEESERRLTLIRSGVWGSTALSFALLLLLVWRVIKPLQARVSSQFRELRALNDRLAGEVRGERASVALRDRALAAAENGIVITDAANDHAVIHCNDAMCRNSGYAREEILGRNLRFLQGKDTDPKAVRTMHDAIADGVGCTVNVLNYRKDNSRFWSEMTFSPVRDEAGAVTHFVGIQVDVTERKAAERERDRIFELGEDLFCTANFEGHFTRVSPAFTRVLGHSQEELLARRCHEFVHADDRARTMAEVEKLGNGVKSLHFENRYRCADGSWKWLQWNAAPSSEDDLIYAVARDITGQKADEERLRASEAKVRDMFNSAVDAIINIDERGRIESLNPAVERLFGYAPSALIGENVSRLMPDPHRSAHDGYLKNYLTTRQPQIIGTGRELTGLRKDGSVFPIHLAVSEFRHKDRSLFTGVIRDITDLQSARARLEAREAGIRQLYQATATADDFADAIRRALRAGCEIFGMEMGILWFEVDGRYLIQAVHTPFDAAFKEGNDFAAGDTFCGTILKQESPVLIHQVGESQWKDHPMSRQFGVAAYCGAPVRTRSSVYGAIALYHRQPRAEPFSKADRDLLAMLAAWVGNTMEFFRDQERLHDATAAAERANRAKSEFLSRMSHELRTPLNSILGFAQLLGRADLPERSKQNVGRIRKAGGLLLQLINEVLDIARIEAGGLGISLEPVAVHQAVQEVTELLRTQAAERDITLHIEPGDTGQRVLADQQRLKQVLLNLGANGIKYNRAGGRLTFGWQRQPGSTVRLTVQDTGAGIPNEDLERIFVPFERLGAERTKVEGTGLGLALCERLVAAMKSRLGVESELGKGSTFSIELTEAEDALPDLKDNGVRLQAEAPVGDQSPLTLLYVEDNLENVRLMEELLLLRPHVELLTAMQASVGLQLARDRRPDVIFLDLHLPDQNGDVVLQELKADDRTRDIPVYMLTADAQHEQEGHLLQLGAREYVTKPIDVDRILAILDQLKPENS